MGRGAEAGSGVAQVDRGGRVPLRPRASGIMVAGAGVSAQRPKDRNAHQEEASGLLLRGTVPSWGEPAARL
jgi:hypothetical protein